MKVFIIHGSYGHPGENWFPWLKKELEELNFEVFVPKFPTPERQNLENWMKVFSEYENKLDENTIMIGHSLGPVFILHILEKINHSIHSCFFISGSISPVGDKRFDKIEKEFLKNNFNWEKIKQNCKKFFVFHSDNDPYVPMEKATELVDKLNAELDIIKNAGHFNEDSGYKEFPLLLRKILEVIQ